MDTPPARRLEQVLADFTERYGALSRAWEQMRALSVTASSRNGVVEVTVGADGRTAEVRFTHEGVRELTMHQLGESVREALTTARSEAAARAIAVLTSAGSVRSSLSFGRTHRDGAEASDANLETPTVCRRRWLREAGAVALAPVPAPSPGEPGTEVTADARGLSAPEAPGGLPSVTSSGSREPLWGGSRSGTRSVCSRTPFQEELREAVLALRAALCGTLSGSCLGATGSCAPYPG
ncbi:YbaB/EbfC family nucleoid-associated protein [Streptomyces sp. NPDC002690]